MKVIPFSLFVRDVNLCSSFEYSILRELSNLLGFLGVLESIKCKTLRVRATGVYFRK